MDKIVWQLGADSSQVRSEMAAAMRSGKEGAQGIANSFDKAEASHERLLRSSHRVSHQISNVVKDFMSGASAGDIFATSLEGIGRSLNLSLGALTALGVGALGVGKIHQVIAEYQRLNEEIDKLTAPRTRADFQQLATLEAHLNTVSEKAKELRGQGGGQESGFGWLKDLFRMWGADGSQARPGETMYQMVKRQRKEKIAGLDESADRDRGDLAIKFQHRMAIREDALGGEAPFITKARELQATANEKPHDTQQAVVELQKELALAFKELAQSVSSKRMERSGMSLKEMSSALPDVVDNSVSYEKWKASQDAKRALGLDAAGEAQRLNFNPAGAHDLFNQAGEAKESITGLKPSEKMSADFKGALAVSEGYLKQLAESKAVFVNK